MNKIMGAWPHRTVASDCDSVIFFINFQSRLLGPKAFCMVLGPHARARGSLGLISVNIAGLILGQSPHRISAGGSLLFIRCVSLTLTGVVSAGRRGEAPSTIPAKPLSDCVTVLCLRQCKSRHLKVCGILKKIHVEYRAFLTEVCVVMLWVTPATSVVAVSFFF